MSTADKSYIADIVRELREDAKIADAGDHPEDGCRWAITMRCAADEIERLRHEVSRYREAALLAHGGLSAINGDGRANELISILNKYLFPTLSAGADENSK